MSEFLVSCGTIVHVPNNSCVAVAVQNVRIQSYRRRRHSSICNSRPNSNAHKQHTCRRSCSQWILHCKHFHVARLHVQKPQNVHWYTLSLSKWRDNLNSLNVSSSFHHTCTYCAFSKNLQVVSYDWKLAMHAFHLTTFSHMSPCLTVSKIKVI